MAGKNHRPAMWNRLAGKKVCFSGKFDWGVRERLTLLAREQGATMVKDVGPRLDFLVVQKTPSAKTLSQRVKSLNAKGATIQIVDADDFEIMVAPTNEEAIDVIRRGSKGVKFFNDAIPGWGGRLGGSKASRVIAGESFVGLDLSSFDLQECDFDSCDFSRTKLQRTQFHSVARCKFDKAAGKADFARAEECSFKGAKLAASNFSDGSDLDFTGADLSEADFNKYAFAFASGKMSNAVFNGATLQSAKFSAITLVQPDFGGADLSKAYFGQAIIDAGNFRNASLADATMGGSKFKNADFSGANLRNANLADADLTGATFDGADLTGANLRGAKAQGVDFSKAKGYLSDAQAPIVAGPVLLELDKAIAKAKRIEFEFQLAAPPKGADPKDKRATSVTGDSSNLAWGWGVRTAADIPRSGSLKKTTMSDELLLAARVLGEVNIRFETLEIQTTKSALKAGEFRDVLVRALCEAFSQQPPDANRLAGLVKARRQRKLKATAGMRKQREAQKKRVETAKARELKKVEQKVAKAVGGKVTDTASFLKALEVRADKAKIDKATKMLKAERFQLFNDLTDDHLAGVVKSQTDPDLVYACRIASDGKFACCTQNLNICGGLQGSICKHLLVLIVGLVNAKQLDPTTIDGWISKTHQHKPALDKEKMGEIFIRYKGAEAGEVDWRPTETVPEDYYAL